MKKALGLIVEVKNMRILYYEKAIHSGPAPFEGGDSTAYLYIINPQKLLNLGRPRAYGSDCSLVEDQAMLEEAEAILRGKGKQLYAGDSRIRIEKVREMTYAPYGLFEILESVQVRDRAQRSIDETLGKILRRV